ncbi:hypothetical protein LX36DRAFT_660302 [Colletotrichum falcatum]|nr:hypothetical protein LX36DRAFT_660302 [Colletotrichum falcatum]
MDSASTSPYHMDASNRRLRNSCDCCTQLKLKCDQKKPSCNRCIQRRRNCVYSQVRKAGRPPKVRNKHRRPNMDILPQQRRRDTFPWTPSPQESAFSSTSPTDMIAYPSPESRTSSPSTSDAMEEGMMGCYNHWVWNWNSCWNFPPDQGGSWLFIYETNTAAEANPGTEVLSDARNQYPPPVSDLDLQYAIANQETSGHLGHLPVQHINMPPPKGFHNSALSHPQP